jgi:4-hydroxy-tetrahydrodipicolinate reductase
MIHHIKVIINGAKGKMGVEAVKAVTNDPLCELVARTGRDDNLKDVLKSCPANVVVDLTHPDSVRANIEAILNGNAHAVVGTTGLSETDLTELDQLAKKNNKCLFVCPNFAIGAILMMKFSAEAAKYLPEVEIIELHHNKKADAPSGTALKTAELIYESNPDVNKAPLQETEIISGARGGRHKNIPIHSVRLPGLVANQEVILGGLGQTLTLKHDTISRESFMPGILHCIKTTQAHAPGLVYGLEKLI